MTFDGCIVICISKQNLKRATKIDKIGGDDDATAGYLNRKANHGRELFDGVRAAVPVDADGGAVGARTASLECGALDGVDVAVAGKRTDADGSILGERVARQGREGQKTWEHLKNMSIARGARDRRGRATAS